MIPGFKKADALGDNVIVRIHEFTEVADGLLTVPDNARQAIPPVAEVVSIGPDAEEKHPALEVGDLVQLRTGSYQSIYMEGETLWMVDASHLRARVQPGPAIARMLKIEAEVSGGLVGVA